MSFIILAIISSLVWWLLLRIGKWWLLSLPAFLLTTYLIDRLNQFSFKKFTPKIEIEQGITISWIIVMIGLVMLAESQKVWRLYSGFFLICINTLLLVISYYTHYKEWTKNFFRWLISGRCITTLLWIIKYNIDLNFAIKIITIGTIRIGIICHIIPFSFTLSQKENENLNQKKEIISYLFIYLLCYWILWSSYMAVIALQLWFITVFISLRQQFLSYESHIQHEKQVWLTGRALLQWQKVLKRYASKKDSEYTIMNTAKKYSLIPSHYGLRFLQISQWILILLLIIVSIRWLRHDNTQSLLRYWLGVACFVINIFVLDRQDKFFNRYKKFALVILSSAFYLTLFYNTHINNTFVMTSLGWNCLNMFICLFYDTIIPLQKRILNRQDLIFWMLWTSGTSIITLLSLGSLKLPGDVIFALWCIIVGMISFFSYHIRKKYHN